MSDACLPLQSLLEEAVTELDKLGVVARPMWIPNESSTELVPGIEISGNTYTIPRNQLLDKTLRTEWIAIVATHARGVSS